MRMEDFLRQIEGVRRSGNGWIAPCPAHDDKRPSLSISLGNDQRILIFCFTGCSTAEICEALNIGVSDLFPSKSRSRRVR